MKSFFTIFLLTIAQLVFGQQLSQLSTTGGMLRDYNPSMLSENYFLFESSFSVDVNYRAQWLALEGHPVTQSLAAQNLFETKRGFSLLVGGRLVNDETGPTGLLGGYLNVAGLLSEDPYYGAIGLGISVGAAQYRVNTREFKPRHGGDILTQEQLKQTYPDVGFGISYYKKMRNNWLENGYVWGGVSVPQMISSEVAFENGAGEFKVKKLAHVVVSGGLQKYFTKTSMVQPTFALRYVAGAPVNIDFNVDYYNSQLFWIGAGASSNSTLLFEAGVLLADNVGLKDKLRLGYQFGYSLKDYGVSVGNIHEFKLSYSFD